jgi:hypothetical protein
MYQMAGIYSKWPYNIPTFPVPDPPKFTQIRIFGSKIYHMATLIVIQVMKRTLAFLVWLCALWQS